MIAFPGLGLGCAGLGNLFAPMSDPQARATIDAAWDAGMLLFDTAPFYGCGLSERRVGDALRDRPRGDFILSSKVGRLLRPDDAADTSVARFGYVSPLRFTPHFDYSYDGIMRSHEDSLQRLGLDRIDVLFVHDIGVATHGADNNRHFGVLADSGYRALAELRDSGDVSAIGLGVNEWEVCAQAMDIGKWDLFLLAGRYTLLEQEPLHAFLPRCQVHGAGIILGGVFNSGILATGTRDVTDPCYNYAPAPPEILTRVGRIEAVCDAFRVTLAAAALQFPQAHPAVRSVIPGARSPQQVREINMLQGEMIPGSFWQALKDEGLLDTTAPVPQAAMAG